MCAVPHRLVPVRVSLFIMWAIAGVISIPRKDLDLRVAELKKEERLAANVLLRRTGPEGKLKFGIPHKNKKMCLIVETRADPSLIRHVLYMAQHLPRDWPITLMHGEDNAHFLRSNDRIMRLAEKGSLILHHLGVANISKEDYNVKMLANHGWWETIGAEHVLLAESDSVYCPNSTHRLDDFLAWGFIGAQCRNSGFSMWRRSVAMCVTKRMNYSTSWGAWPDVYMNEMIEKHKCGKSVQREICDHFSVETQYLPNSLGMHTPVIPCSSAREVVAFCPEIQHLVQITYCEFFLKKIRWH